MDKLPSEEIVVNLHAGMTQAFRKRFYKFKGLNIIHFNARNLVPNI